MSDSDCFTSSEAYMYMLMYMYINVDTCMHVHMYRRRSRFACCRTLTEVTPALHVTAVLTRGAREAAVTHAATASLDTVVTDAIVRTRHVKVSRTS